MPHATFPTGNINSTTDAVPRELIPGIGPGGSRVGQPTKPALLIRDVYVVPLSVVSDASRNFASFFLKLSQETDLVPGLILPIAQLHGEEDDATGYATQTLWQQGKKLAGTVWVPRNIGIRIVITGYASGVNAVVHLDYDVVDIPWMDWFLMWDFLDNIVDNDQEY